MKKINFIVLSLFTCALFNPILAQTNNPNCAILNIKHVGQTSSYSSEIIGNITRREFSKLGIYEILYAQDIEPLISNEGKNGQNPFDCYSKQCLTNIGKKVGVEKMLSGQIEELKDGTIISFRIIDVKNNKVENSITKEFLKLEDQLKNMIIITLREMMGLENDKELERLLIKEFSRESYINNNGINSLNLSGTRMGVVTLLGSNKEIIKLPESQGGFDASPFFFNFGYQFEKQYLNQGRIQGLFEFIPSVTGLEQGLFIPSLTVLHGIRDNKSGFEFAFGPTFGVTPIATGYYDNDNEWNLEAEWDNQQPFNPTDTVSTPNPYPIETRLDSRGEYQLSTGFLIGMGFSLKSGNINIPINIYTVFQKKSLRTGISIGLNNSKKTRTYF